MERGKLDGRQPPRERPLLRAIPTLLRRTSACTCLRRLAPPAVSPPRFARVQLVNRCPVGPSPHSRLHVPTTRLARASRACCAAKLARVPVLPSAAKPSGTPNPLTHPCITHPCRGSGSELDRTAPATNPLYACRKGRDYYACMRCSAGQPVVGDRALIGSLARAPSAAGRYTGNNKYMYKCRGMCRNINTSSSPS